MNRWYLPTTVRGKRETFDSAKEGRHVEKSAHERWHIDLEFARHFASRIERHQCSRQVAETLRDAKRERVIARGALRVRRWQF